MKHLTQSLLTVGLLSMSCTTLAAPAVSMKLTLDSQSANQTQTFAEELGSGKVMCQANLPQNATATILGQDNQKLATLYGQQPSYFQLNSAQPLTVQVDPLLIIHLIMSAKTMVMEFRAMCAHAGYEPQNIVRCQFYCSKHECNHISPAITISCSNQ